MRALGLAAAAAVSVMASGCAVLPDNSSISGDWSCRAVGAGSCSDIASNDVMGTVEPGAAVSAVPAGQPAQYANDRPTFYGRQVLRVTLAPWVDAEGRFHVGSTVFAPYGQEMWGASENELDR